jgi:hypothetical protein
VKNGVSAGAGSTYSYKPVNGDQVYVIMTSSLMCKTGSPATSNTVTMNISPAAAVGVSISSSANPGCEGSSVTYSATSVNGGTSPSYQWTVNGTAITGATGSTYSCVPVNDDEVMCTMTSNASCISGNPATSNIIYMSVNSPLAVSVSVSPSANPVCTGTSVTFTPAPVNGGTPSYQWYRNGTPVGASVNYTFVPVSGDQVYVVMTSSLTCKSGSPATSNTVTMAVNPKVPVSVSIAPSANPSCQGSPVTLAATPVNGGIMPVYQWQINGTAVSESTNSTYTYLPQNDDEVMCSITSNASCISGNPATSNTVYLVVNDISPVSVSISSSGNNVCAGTTVTFTPVPVNGGTPLFQWYKNNVVSGTGPDYSCVPSDGDAVYAVMTSSLLCNSGSPATSNTVTVAVNPVLVPGVTVSPSATTVCQGYAVTFAATPVNGGSNPGYQWMVNGFAVTGATGSGYSYVPANGDEVICIMTSDITCVSENPVSSEIISMTVNSVQPVSVLISPSVNPVQEGSPVTCTALPVNGGSAPVFQWYLNGAPVGINAGSYTYIPVNNDQVWCEMTSSATCPDINPAVSNTLIMLVVAVPLNTELPSTVVSDTRCFNALQTINVAGNGEYFTIQPGGNVVMIAGQNILLFPGTTVTEGGYLYGYISPSGPWCITPGDKKTMGMASQAKPETGRNFRVYPNPTTGEFIVELTGNGATTTWVAEIYDLLGNQILTQSSHGAGRIGLSLKGRPYGIYMVRVISDTGSKTTRIILQEF